MLKRPVERGFLGRREEAQRDPADGASGAEDVHPRRDRQRARRRCDEAGLRGRQRAPGRRPRFSRHHPLTSACSTISIQTWCTSCPTAASSRRAGRSLPSRSRRTAMPTSLEEGRVSGACAGQTGSDRDAAGRDAGAHGRGRLGWRGAVGRRRAGAGHGPADTARRVLEIYRSGHAHAGRGAARSRVRCRRRGAPIRGYRPAQAGFR